MTVLMLSAFAACGGGDTPCEEAGKALCEAACACGTCEIGDANGSIGFDDQAGCEAFLVGLGCSGDDGSLDAQFESCTAAVADAECIDPGDGSSILESPVACDL